jgi:hypothetical protein
MNMSSNRQDLNKVFTAQSELKLDGKYTNDNNGYVLAYVSNYVSSNTP